MPTTHRPILPEVTAPTGQRCSNAEPGTFNHECGKPAHHAVTYWSDTFDDWFTTFYCHHCLENGYEGRSSRAKAVRIVSVWPSH
jgi:hypothetical protein